MIYRWLTDLTVTIHFAFLIFVVAGGIAARRYRWLIVPHLLCVPWAVFVEATPDLVFVWGGGIAAPPYRWLIVPHLLCVAWAIYVEATPGLVCPLTPLENYFATRAGLAGYEGSFIEHYLVPILYPHGLTRTPQLTLAGLVLGINLAVYAWSPVRRLAGKRHRASSDSSSS